MEDLRTLSQADAGELRLNREPVAAQALLERMAKSYEQLAAQEQVALEVQVEPPCSPQKALMAALLLTYTTGSHPPPKEAHSSKAYQMKAVSPQEDLHPHIFTMLFMRL